MVTETRMGWLEIQEVRQRLVAAFKDLRKQNIVARCNFEDCQSCAGALLADMIEARPKAIGYVFWHHQGEAHLQNGDGMRLYFGGRGDDDAQTTLVGNLVVNALRDHNVPVSWDYSPTTSIAVGQDS